MIKIYPKIWFILDLNEKRRALQLLTLMTLTSIIEIAGVGSIMPFLSVLGNPDVIETNRILFILFQKLNFSNKQYFLVFLGLLSLVILFVSALFKSLTSYSKFRFINNRRHSIGKKLLRKYLHQPYKFFLSKNSSEISRIILSETDIAIQQGLLPSINLISNLILTLSIVGLLIMIDPILALILASVFGGFYTIMFITIRKRLTHIGKKRIKSNSMRFKFISEIIGGIKDLKVLGREKVYYENFKVPSSDFSKFTSTNQTLSEIPQFMMEVIAFGALLTMSIYSILFYSSDIGSLLPVLGLYALGAVKLKPSVNKMYSSLSAMKFGDPAIDNIVSDLKNVDSEGYVLSKNDNKRLFLKKELSLKEIEFKYQDNSRLALKNINLHIKVNSTVGIIGTTGSGKSTLVDIILGILFPVSGKILIDGKVLNKSSIRMWQNNIGYVPQNIFLSDEDIASNIAFGIEKDLINMNQVKKVAKMAMAHGFISKLESGYNTVIGERGIRLSGGQRQRLGIARALYHNPDLLILDEATSSLDTQTEKDVMKAINNMIGSKTIIIVAHRLSTIEKCDLIIRLDEGKIK